MNYNVEKTGVSHFSLFTFFARSVAVATFLYIVHIISMCSGSHAALALKLQLELAYGENCARLGMHWVWCWMRESVRSCYVARAEELCAGGDREEQGTENWGKAKSLGTKISLWNLLKVKY